MKRIQRKRIKGWRMPENAVYVGRPTKWGNPFKLDEDGFIVYFSKDKLFKDGDPWRYWSYSGGFSEHDIVDLYRMWIKGRLRSDKVLGSPPKISEIKEELKGKDLVCWCHLDKPCHADLLIKICHEKA